jgi:hypothetical protein
MRAHGANKKCGWQRRSVDPRPLPDGRKPGTLTYAGGYVVGIQNCQNNRSVSCSLSVSNFQFECSLLRVQPPGITSVAT